MGKRLDKHATDRREVVAQQDRRWREKGRSEEGGSRAGGSLDEGDSKDGNR